MNILCIGDIVGRPGREALAVHLPRLKIEHASDLVIVNAENASGGSGIIPKNADEIFAMGVDVITLGDHAWDKQTIYPYLDENKQKIVRPANFPEGAPGVGGLVITAHNGVKVGVINLLGRTFMRYNVACPFRMLEAMIATMKSQAAVIIVDMHAETTSEKVAIGHFADGKVSCVFGTHTHVQTADEQVLPKGTGYITDLGMSGPVDSVIGQNKEKIITRFLSSMPQKFEVAQNLGIVQGVSVNIDEATGIARGITRIQVTSGMTQST